MKRLLLAAALCLSACDGCLPESWKVPPHVAFERMAAARLQSCVQNNPCQFLRQCFAESEAYCVDAGYSARCGFGEPEGSCGVNVGGSPR